MTQRSGVLPFLPPLTLCSSGLLRLLQETFKHLVMMWKLNPIRPTSFPNLKLVCVACENIVRLGLCWAGEINKVAWSPSCEARPGCGCHRLEKQWTVPGFTLQGTLINHGSFYRVWLMTQRFLCTVDSTTNHPSLLGLLSPSPCHQLRHGIHISTQDTQMQQGPGIVVSRPLLFSSRVSRCCPCSYRFSCITPSKETLFRLVHSLSDCRWI